MRFFLYHKRFGGQMFDVDESIADDLKEHLYAVGWRKNKFLAADVEEKSDGAAVQGAQETQGDVDLSATDEALAAHGKKALVSAAKKELGVDLDGRRNIHSLIADIRAAQEA